MPFDMKFSNPNAAKAAALKLAREKAASPSAEEAKIQKWISPAEAKERIGIVFDDSGSMQSEIENAREGSIEFLRNCVPNQTAVAIFLLNARKEHWYSEEEESPTALVKHNKDLEALNSDLIDVAQSMKNKKFSLGGTPLFKTLKKALDSTPKLTRIVAFTDGSATDSLVPYNERPLDHKSSDSNLNWEHKASADILIAQAKEQHAPIDTIFFGENTTWNQEPITLLKYLAEGTGGYFMIFDPKKVSFRSAFKYLAPVNRLALASESVRREIESGKKV